MNGKVITVDSRDSIAEAVAIKDNKILKVGSVEEIKKLIDKGTQIINMEERTVLPGFIDSHTHSLDYSINLRHCLQIHVPPLKSVKEALELLKNRLLEFNLL